MIHTAPVGTHVLPYPWSLLSALRIKLPLLALLLPGAKHKACKVPQRCYSPLCLRGWVRPLTCLLGPSLISHHYRIEFAPAMAAHAFICEACHALSCTTNGNVGSSPHSNTPFGARQAARYGRTRVPSFGAEPKPATCSAIATVHGPEALQPPPMPTLRPPPPPPHPPCACYRMPINTRWEVRPGKASACTCGCC